MNRLFSSRLMAFSALASMILFAVMVLVVPTSDLIELLNGLFLGLAVLVGIVWGPGLARTLVSRGPVNRVKLFAAGIGCIWLSVLLQRLLSFAYRYFGRPDGWTDHWAWSLAIWLAMMGAVYHIAASGTDDTGRFNDPERLLLYIGVPASLAATLIFLGLQGHA